MPFYILTQVMKMPASMLTIRDHLNYKPGKQCHVRKICRKRKGIYGKQKECSHGYRNGQIQEIINPYLSYASKV